MAIFLTTLAGNHKNYPNIIKVSEPFTKEIIEICSEENFEQMEASDDHLPDKK